MEGGGTVMFGIYCLEDQERKTQINPEELEDGVEDEEYFPFEDEYDDDYEDDEEYEREYCD